MSPVPGLELISGIDGDSDGDDLLFLIILDHTVPMVLSTTQYFIHVVRRFRVDRNPGEHRNTFRYGCQMGEKRGSSIGFSNVIDGTHHRLQVLQDLHIDWGLNVWLPGFGCDDEKFALRSKGSKDSSRLGIQGSAY